MKKKNEKKIVKKKNTSGKKPVLDGAAICSLSLNECSGNVNHI